MRFHRLSRFAGAICLCAGAAWAASAATADKQPNAPKWVEVLARGPVHEAYAEPSEVQPQAGPVVPEKNRPILSPKRRRIRSRRATISDGYPAIRAGTARRLLSPG